MRGENTDTLEMIPGYDAPSSWWEHVPIAHWLIKRLKPGLVVELGTHYGVSFFAFCESAEIYSEGTFCYAVDTWEGDSQAGFYGNEVYEKVSQYFNAKHKSRGRLIRSTFDDAATHFEDNTIDLIHIDGLHTYEAVKHDYKTWLSKLKEGGTLMFHDWNVREADFGVWRLWEEIKASGNFQCIEIKNGHGLAIATNTNTKPEWHDELTKTLPILKTKGWLLDELRRTKNFLEASDKELAARKKNEQTLAIQNDELRQQIIELQKVLNIYKKGLLYRGIRKLIRKIKSITKWQC